MSFRNEQNLPKERSKLSFVKLLNISCDFRLNCGNDKQHNSKLGAIKLSEPRKAQHLQLCNFVHSACRLVIIELMQQCQEMNLALMTRNCEQIMQKRQLSCKGIIRD